MYKNLLKKKSIKNFIVNLIKIYLIKSSFFKKNNIFNED